MPLGSYLLNSTANSAHLHSKTPKWHPQFFSYFQYMLFSSFHEEPTNHFCAHIFGTYYCQDRWCDGGCQRPKTLKQVHTLAPNIWFIPQYHILSRFAIRLVLDSNCVKLCSKSKLEFEVCIFCFYVNFYFLFYFPAVG